MPATLSARPEFQAEPAKKTPGVLSAQRQEQRRTGVRRGYDNFGWSSDGGPPALRGSEKGEVFWKECISWAQSLWFRVSTLTSPALPGEKDGALALWDSQRWLSGRGPSTQILTISTHEDGSHGSQSPAEGQGGKGRSDCASGETRSREAHRGNSHFVPNRKSVNVTGLLPIRKLRFSGRILGFVKKRSLSLWPEVKGDCGCKQRTFRLPHVDGEMPVLK